MKSIKMIWVIALSAAASAMLPTAAIAKSGYISCQVQRSANKWVLYAEPFRADSASEDIMTQAFSTYLTSGFSPFVAKDETTLGGCHWEAKQDQAFDVLKGFIKKYASHPVDHSSNFQRFLKSK